jgi:hypothetical protein
MDNFWIIIVIVGSILMCIVTGCVVKTEKPNMVDQEMTKTKEVPS